MCVFACVEFDLHVCIYKMGQLAYRSIQPLTRQ